jgi:7,8-dihydropterin-6-yl-methyl-4-(beta-D-ribofuranosyl)aminobenzene 5'-phosphate synthase
MNIRLGISFTVFALAASIVFANGELEVGETTISIVLDDYSEDPELERQKGFGCVVQTPVATILFDTGSRFGAGKVLLSNMDKMNIDPLDIDIVFISHSHFTAGLEDFLKKNPNVTVYGPETLNIGRLVENSGAKYQELNEFTKIAKHIYSTGGFRSDTDSNMEQSLVIDTELGSVVICGCSHPGIINVLERVMDNPQSKKIHLVIGGFHLEYTPQENREEILQHFIELGVQKVAPCHCSGRFRENAEQGYKENYIECGVGLIIRI